MDFRLLLAILLTNLFSSHCFAMNPIKLKAYAYFGGFTGAQLEEKHELFHSEDDEEYEYLVTYL